MLDRNVGQVLDLLAELGLEKDTIVFFTGDNGGQDRFRSERYPRGYFGPNVDPRSGAAFRGGKGSLYEGGLRIPFLVRWPGRVPSGRIDRKSIVSAIDIFPTVIEALGGEPPQGLDGRSFLPAALGTREESGRRHAYAAFNYYADSVKDQYFPQRAIIDGDYCYIWNAYVSQPGGDRPFLENGWREIVAEYLDDDHPRLVAKVDAIVHKVPEELFDLGRDPGCWDNLADDPAHAAVLARYRGILEQRMRESADPELANWPHGRE
jgi:arylsulfatase A-like enzyme